MKLFPLFLVLMVSVLTLSCRKGFEADPVTAPSAMEELQVPSNFDWKTTKDYLLNFESKSSGLVTVKGITGVIFQRAFLTADNAYLMKLTVPSYEKKIVVKQGGNIREIALNESYINISLQ